MGQELTQWKYRRADLLNIEELNRLGEKGWEVVGVTTSGVLHADGILKRPKKPQSYSPDYSIPR